METVRKLISDNRLWVDRKMAEDPSYFERLAEGQNPHTLWIGCADSRVPESEVTQARPGDIFVHRNIANMVIHSDMNMLSVLDFAVNTLQVKHVVVCGHYLCGGVKAAIGTAGTGLAANWIRHIKDVYRLYEEDLEQIKDPALRFDRLVEFNVYEQVFDLLKTSIIQEAWKSRQEPVLHGWVFDIRTGLIRDLGITFNSNTQLPDIYRVESEIVR